MKIINLFCILFFLICSDVGFSEALINEKYNNFKLELLLGLNTRELNQAKVKVPSELFDILNDAYSDAKLEAFLSNGHLYSAIKYENQYYALIGEFPVGPRKYTNCNYFDKSKPSANCSREFLLFVDVDGGSVRRIDTRNVNGLRGLGFIFTGGIEDFDTYGCGLNYALQAGDINLDSMPEVFLFDGVGQLFRGSQGRLVKTNINIYDGKRKKLIFSNELSYENFVGEEELPYYNAKGYQYISTVEIDGDGAVVASTVNAAERRYSKLYFLDVDENGLLDILVWRKVLSSRLKTDPVKGYQLTNSVLTRYEETAEGFKEKSDSKTSVEKLLYENNLSWDDGFPNENYCYKYSANKIPLQVEGKLLRDY